MDFITDLNYYLVLTSFLINKKEQKTFDDKISKLSIKTQQNINAAKNSFNRFCQEYYDGRTIDEIFNELRTLKEDEQTQAINEMFQSWMTGNTKTGHYIDKTVHIKNQTCLFS